MNAATFVLGEGAMREVPLTKGRVALVDDEDYERVAALKWYVAGSRRRIWYARRDFSGSSITMHRFILNCQPGQEVDHVNHDGLDNRRCNLRLCSHSENMANGRKRKGASSPYKGVCWHVRRKRWQAQVTYHGRQHHLGRFDSEEEAACAYNAKALELFGEFAYLNIIEGRPSSGP